MQNKSHCCTVLYFRKVKHDIGITLDSHLLVCLYLDVYLYSHVYKKMWHSIHHWCWCMFSWITIEFLQGKGLQSGFNYHVKSYKSMSFYHHNDRFADTFKQFCAFCKSKHICKALQWAVFSTKKLIIIVCYESITTSLMTSRRRESPLIVTSSTNYVHQS